MKILHSDISQRMELLRGNEYFDTMPDSILERIAGHMHLREYERGEALFWEGDACDGLYVVMEGSAKIYRLSHQGRQYIVRVLQERDTFAEVPAFDGSMNPANVEALEACKVWVIESGLLRELILAHPDFAQKVLSNFGNQLRYMVRQVSEMAFYQVTHRLARLISEMPPDEMGTAPIMTQEQMAARLGTVREVVARSIRELERSGAIQVENRRVRILDQAVFRQWTN
jgi:CRP/FNR family transcriptional regulator